MKEPRQLHIPEDRQYSPHHTWARWADDRVRVGITDHAQDQLGEVLFVDLPEPGQSFQADEVFGVVESNKVVSDLHMPLGGEVLATNPLLASAPAVVNALPYDDGWMIEIQPDDPAAMDRLLTAAGYLETLTDT